MFRAAEIGRRVDKKDYEAQVPALRESLLSLQQELRQAPFPVVIVLSGDDRIGIGETLSLLHEWMDPRYLETNVLDVPTDEEGENPEFWRFWRSLPPRGRIGIVFGSWYRKTIRWAVRNPGKTAKLDAELARINFFENELADDGALILKFWLHLKKAHMEKRLRELKSDPKAHWLNLKDERRILRLYDKGRRVIERVLAATSTGEAPWRVVEGFDRRYRNLVIGQTLREELKAHLQTPVPVPTKRAAPARVTADQFTILRTLDLTKRVPKAKYSRQVDKWQSEITRLQQVAIAKRVSAILVFEGWDAAGKGGIIRRVTGAMDARHYRVIPIAAPTEDENRYHYLWRFWRHLPRAGRVTIFDRSWYGRVLVERVEGLATEAEWRRAYREINDFEEQLAEHGIVLVKFWLHIDKAEQLRRFREREKTPYKKYKITADDWRNRAKWDAYEAAVNEMLARTSTDSAPWTLVEANDKYYARLKVLRTFAEALRRSL
jgi:polyphosphate:AMP phosphotransferase